MTLLVQQRPKYNSITIIRRWPDSRQPSSNLINTKTPLCSAKWIFPAQTNLHTFILPLPRPLCLQSALLCLTFNLKLQCPFSGKANIIKVCSKCNDHHSVGITIKQPPLFWRLEHIENMTTMTTAISLQTRSQLPNGHHWQQYVKQCRNMNKSKKPQHLCFVKHYKIPQSYV